MLDLIQGGSRPQPGEAALPYLYCAQGYVAAFLGRYAIWLALVALCTELEASR